MKMIKTLALAVLTPTLIKVATDGYDWMCEQFNCEDKPKRKSPDTTKFNSHAIQLINEKYLHYKTGNSIYKNTQELTEALNRILGVNKSRSVYSKIWNSK